MDSLQLIRRLHQHRAWANRKLCAAAATLTDEQLHRPFDIGRGSLWATLIHLYAAEYAWLEALGGKAEVPLPADGAFANLEELQVAWTALDRRWDRYLGDLTPARLDLSVHKRSTAAGLIFATPASDVLLHVATHAQYTAAQAVNMLRRLGTSPTALPDLQLVTMSRQETQT